MLLREEGGPLHVNEIYNRLLEGGFSSRTESHDQHCRFTQPQHAVSQNRPRNIRPHDPRRVQSVLTAGELHPRKEHPHAFKIKSYFPFIIFSFHCSFWLGVPGNGK